MSNADPTPTAQPSRGGGEVATWQPIDTAPKDGTRILVYFPEIGVWQVLWSTEPYDPEGFWCVSDNKYEERPLRGWNMEPTHWMPPPPPPGSPALPSAPRGYGDFVCAARKRGTAGGHDPADCDWPFCGCDPHACKVIETL